MPFSNWAPWELPSTTSAARDTEHNDNDRDTAPSHYSRSHTPLFLPDPDADTDATDNTNDTNNLPNANANANADTVPVHDDQHSISTTHTTTMPVSHPLLSGADVSLSDIGRQRSHIDDAIGALMSILSNEAKLSDVNTHQTTTLQNLEAMKHNLTDMNRSSNEQYQACVTDFLKASRQARQAKDDLNDISRRLANIKTKLSTI